jgi:branched-subunit amino acid transport protein
VNAISVWTVMLLGGLITFLTRLSFISLMGKMKLSPRLRRALTYVPPAVLTAIIFPEVFLKDGELFLSPGNFRLGAGLLAALVAWRTRNVFLTLLVGMAALLALEALF